ncbi:hypothetical protein VFPFJ_11405 [Purpureocillium lilacinum]|uniref:Uncharacterized protein n=1 Tax=Purpureocillium lilacinum TaxID=33203 RepID=A0A179FB86_PURLI|nr:hypothetical protein VFPFJ_11405 [Purpureocillium lilacinum]OAQ62551.1 hypothetical protein VFPFJ_11405 [Purpureocillium lilacinum]
MPIVEIDYCTHKEHSLAGIPYRDKRRTTGCRLIRSLGIIHQSALRRALLPGRGSLHRPFRVSGIQALPALAASVSNDRLYKAGGHECKARVNPRFC